MTDCAYSGIHYQHGKINIRMKGSTPRKAFLALMIVIWGRHFIFDYARGFMLRIPIVQNVANWVLPVLMLLLLALSSKYIAKSVHMVDLLALVGAIGIFVLNLFLHPETYDYLCSKISGLWLTAIPLYFIGLRMDYRNEIKYLYYVSVLNILSYVVYNAVFGSQVTGNNSIYNNNMVNAYYLLPNVCLVFYFALEEKGIISSIASILGIVSLLVSGTRGPTVLIFLFILIYLLLYKKFKHPFLQYTLIVSAMGIYIKFFKDINLFMYNFAVDHGLYARIFYRLLNGDFFVSSGRDTLKEAAFKAILDRPWIGYGLGGDYGLTGSYVHNLVLELWISFGVVLGSAVLIWMGYLIFQGIRCSTDKTQKIFIVIMSISVIGKLLLSGTFLDEEFFFMFFALCVSAHRMSRKRCALKIARKNVRNI